MPQEKNDEKNLAERFEADRAHLTRVAYRMLGSLPEAEDAVQEGWLRLSRDGADQVGNLTGWLTTVVAHVALDMLRKRKSRHTLAERKVVDAFPAAAREGNFEALLAALDPQVVMRSDETAIRLGGPRQLSGSAAVAKAFQGRAQAARFILADGAPAVLVA